jgi:hypothetical protein
MKIMKHLITIIILVASFQLSQAQVWIELGAKGGYGLSLLYNKNIFDDNTYNHQFTGGNGFGGKIGINFGPHHGFTVDVMSRRMAQKFEYKLLGVFEESQVKWKNLDLYLLYRYSSNTVYLELGPMLSLVRSVDYTDSSIPVEINVEDFYADKYYSAVFGFGGFLVGTESASLNLGVRIHYALQDFITAKGQIQNFPAPIRSSTYTEYKQTRPLYIEVGLELTFGLGEFARTSCSDRMHWFRSGNK